MRQRMTCHHDAIECTHPQFCSFNETKLYVLRWRTSSIISICMCYVVCLMPHPQLWLIAAAQMRMYCGQANKYCAPFLHFDGMRWNGHWNACNRLVAMYASTHTRLSYPACVGQRHTKTQSWCSISLRTQTKSTARTNTNTQTYKHAIEAIAPNDQYWSLHTQHADLQT